MSNTSNTWSEHCKEPDAEKPGTLETVLELLKQGRSPMDALYEAFTANANTGISREEEQVIRDMVLTNAIIDGLIKGGMREAAAVELLSAYTDSVIFRTESDAQGRGTR